MVQKQKNLDTFKTELDEILICIKESFVKLGEKLYDARSILTADEYGKLQEYVEKQGIRKADQRASIAAHIYQKRQNGGSVQEHEEAINPDLVFAGAANSKIISMDAADQARLLSDEKFEVLQPSGRAVKKSWAQMSEQERNTLIDKGGKIRTINEQQDSRFRKNNRLMQPVGSIEINEDTAKFVSRDQTVALHISTDNFIRMLGNKGWDVLLKSKKIVQQENGKAKVAS